MPAELHGHCDQGPERAREDVHTLGEAKQQGLASSWTSSGVRPFWRTSILVDFHSGVRPFWRTSILANAHSGVRQYDFSACSEPTAVVPTPMHAVDIALANEHERFRRRHVLRSTP